jgi:peptide/nickel transport system ATP-binding protein
MIDAQQAPLLSIENLVVTFDTPGHGPAVDGASLDVRGGEVVGLVGSSGAGKSLTALAVLGLLPPSARVTQGSIRFAGVDVLKADQETLRRLRGQEVGTVFQDPLSALHPCMPVGAQVIEGLAWNRGSRLARERGTAAALLRDVGLPDPDVWSSRYPHEWSGGMRQRALMATALAQDPSLLIVDEPTTALDVTTQAQLLELLRGLQDDRGMAVLLITHDLGVVAELADRLYVMDAGRVVESGSVGDVFDHARHPATRFLVRGRVPSRDATHRRSRTKSPTLGKTLDVHAVVAPPGDAGLGVYTTAGEAPALEVQDLSVRFGGTRAVASVDLLIREGGALGLVGESGCGKSTIARAIVGLEAGATGRIRVDGRDVLTASPSELRKIRRIVQVVWQDPHASLNPRRSVGWAVARPLRVHRLIGRTKARLRARELLERVGLPGFYASRRPHELSGGERQRVAIARALALQPRLLVLDEPFSALDAALRAGLLQLLDELRRELGVAYLLISHDLSVVRAIVETVAVAYLGRVVEQGRATTVFSRPAHPYTQALFSATPVDHPRDRGSAARIILDGEVPSAARRPSGCAFRTRCWKAQTACVERVPDLLSHLDADHAVACLFPGAEGEADILRPGSLPHEGAAPYNR